MKSRITLHILILISGIFLFLEIAYSQDESLASKIDQFATENDFNGTVLIKNQNDIIYHKSFGLANRESIIRNTNHTQYAIASITKLFTSVIILQLLEEGKIDLSHMIKEYLPDYKGKGGNKVTIHHLLTHTSGIQNCETIDKGRSNDLPGIYTEDLGLDEIIEKYCSGPVTRPVGKSFEYNNGDYIILGKIIETISGISFSKFLSQRILMPLKMDRTGLIINSGDMQQLAQGYKWNQEVNAYERDPQRYYENYFTSGAMYSTANDLIKFTDALFNGSLLSKSSLELLLRTYPETKSYGYGLWVRYPRYNKTVPKVAQRFGRIWGINTLLSHFIDQDITVIVLANTNKVHVSEFQHIAGEELLD